MASALLSTTTAASMPMFEKSKAAASSRPKRRKANKSQAKTGTKGSAKAKSGSSSGRHHGMVTRSGLGLATLTESQRNAAAGSSSASGSSSSSSSSSVSSSSSRGASKASKVRSKKASSSSSRGLVVKTEPGSGGKRMSISGDLGERSTTQRRSLENDAMAHHMFNAQQSYASSQHAPSTSAAPSNSSSAWVNQKPPPGLGRYPHDQLPHHRFGLGGHGPLADHKSANTQAQGSASAGYPGSNTVDCSAQQSRSNSSAAFGGNSQRQNQNPMAAAATLNPNPAQTMMPGLGVTGSGLGLGQEPLSLYPSAWAGLNHAAHHHAPVMPGLGTGFGLGLGQAALLQQQQQQQQQQQRSFSLSSHSSHSSRSSSQQPTAPTASSSSSSSFFVLPDTLSRGSTSSTGGGGPTSFGMPMGQQSQLQQQQARQAHVKTESESQTQLAYGPSLLYSDPSSNIAWLPGAPAGASHSHSLSLSQPDRENSASAGNLAGFPNENYFREDGGLTFKVKAEPPTGAAAAAAATDSTTASGHRRRFKRDSAVGAIEARKRARLTAVERSNNPDVFLDPEDHLASMKKHEAACQHLLLDNYMELQKHLNNRMRLIVIDWLFEVEQEYGLDDRTMFLAINYLDRFLSQIWLRRDQLQLVGSVCLFLASKFQEIDPPTAQQFTEIADGTFERSQLLETESCVLGVLEFRLSMTPSLDFLHFFGRHFDVNAETRHLAQYLLSLFTEAEYYGKFLPSHEAAAALYLAQVTLTRDLSSPWTAEHVRVTGHDRDAVVKCAELMKREHIKHYRTFVAHYLYERNAPGHAISDKFATRAYSEVSKKVVPLEYDGPRVEQPCDPAKLAAGAIKCDCPPPKCQPLRR